MNIYQYLYQHPMFKTSVSIFLAVPPEIDPSEAVGFEAWAGDDHRWVIDDDPTRIIHPVVSWAFIQGGVA